MLREFLIALVALFVLFGLFGCGSVEKRDAALPATTRNVEQSTEKTNEGQQVLSKQHELIAAGATPEEVAAVGSDLPAIKETIREELKNGLDATMPDVMGGIDSIWNWMMGSLGVIGVGAGRKPIAKVLGAGT